MTDLDALDTLHVKRGRLGVVRADQRLPAHGRGGIVTKVQLRERYADILRAEVAGEDLQEGPGCIHVCAMRIDGTLYKLGHVSADLCYQDRAAADFAISRIKFGHPRKATGEAQG